MAFLPNLIFAFILIVGIGFFTRNISKLRRNINLGREIDLSDQPKLRWKNMALIALGQGKMVRRPIAGILHIIVYVGFIIINIEVLEIIIDGLFGTHRIFSTFLGSFYGLLIGSFELLAALVFLSVIVFWFRRNVVKIKRFLSSEMKGWPKLDGNIILYFEIILMGLFITMNATDVAFQEMNSGNWVSQFFVPFFEGYNQHYIERTSWWLHIIGILVFLNYLYYSKHLHILLAFPNTYYGKLEPKGEFDNLDAVTNEVKLMMDPNA